MMVEVPREISQNVKARVMVLALCTPLMLVDICMRFHDADLNGLKVIERKRWRQDFVMEKVPRKINKPE